jgi:hypothetical protein
MIKNLSPMYISPLLNSSENGFSILDWNILADHLSDSFPKIDK